MSETPLPVRQNTGCTHMSYLTGRSVCLDTLTAGTALQFLTGERPLAHTRPQEAQPVPSVPSVANPPPLVPAAVDAGALSQVAGTVGTVVCNVAYVAIGWVP